MFNKNNCYGNIVHCWQCFLFIKYTLASPLWLLLPSGNTKYIRKSVEVYSASTAEFWLITVRKAYQ